MDAGPPARRLQRRIGREVPPCWRHTIGTDVSPRAVPTSPRFGLRAASIETHMRRSVFSGLMSTAIVTIRLAAAIEVTEDARQALPCLAAPRHRLSDWMSFTLHFGTAPKPHGSGTPPGGARRSCS